MRVLLLPLLLLSFSLYADEKKDTVEAKKEESKLMAAADRSVNKHAFGIGIGQTFLTEEFQEYGDNKITTDLLYSYAASYSFDLLLNLHSSSHSYAGKDVHLRGFTTAIKARLYDFDAFSPFYIGGFGFYQPQIQKNGVESKRKTTFGVHVGGGADLRLNANYTVGLLAHLHKPFDIKQEETNTVRGSYLKLLMTLMYHF